MTELDALIALARKKGTDKQYREWVQRQPSAISGGFSEWLQDLGEWRNPACHVRRAGKSGIAYKEQYACIPLTHAEHRTQHHSGELVCLALHMTSTALEQLFAGLTDAQALPVAKDWFDRQRIKYLKAWLES